ncbi:hypothetical protein ACH5RR_039739 [Cinchona calisaya]|uniref:Uncharacterized protein n=1 Tax=Cinchona calisaya TaxID=153742 RepID=A0ABD2XZ54_9GENT
MLCRFGSEISPALALCRRLARDGLAAFALNLRRWHNVNHGYGCCNLQNMNDVTFSFDLVHVRKLSGMEDNTNTSTDCPCPDLLSSSIPSGPPQSSSKVDKGKAAIPSLPLKDSKVPTTTTGC